MGISNTPPRPPFAARSTEELLVDLDVSLRNAEGDGLSPRGLESIEHVQQIHSELNSRGVHLGDFLLSLSRATGWRIDQFLQECLEYPGRMPAMRLLNGARRSYLCYRCGLHERPETGVEFALCSACLREALEALRQ